MDIERDLEFARKCVMTSSADIVTKTRVDETLQSIARQSVTSEEVQRAIELLREPSKCMDYYWLDAQMHDALNLAITALQAYQPWIPVSERLPEKPEYDWVLVHITLYPDGFVGLPHVAELRRGEWFSTEYDLPIEQILQGTVTHWKPLPEIPKGE